jgi:hypothetical protein
VLRVFKGFRGFKGSKASKVLWELRGSKVFKVLRAFKVQLELEYKELKVFREDWDHRVFKVLKD